MDGPRRGGRMPQVHPDVLPDHGVAGSGGVPQHPHLQAPEPEALGTEADASTSRKP